LFGLCKIDSLDTGASNFDGKIREKLAKMYDLAFFDMMILFVA
jgi:xylose isomerase